MKRANQPCSPSSTPYCSGFRQGRNRRRGENQERIKGKVQGDVKIYFHDGTVRSEDWLVKKLNFIDKKTYRSIFSFDVLGLQDIHKNMTEDKLQEYLLRAGALGSHKYDEMLSAIDTE